MAVNKKKNQAKQGGRHSLLQPEENALTVRYTPWPGQSVMENPPRFQWIPPQVGRHNYELELQPMATKEGADADPVIYSDISFPFFTPQSALAPGHYAWRYRTVSNGRGASDWSEPRVFKLHQDATEAPFAFDRNRVTSMRPRLAIAPDGHKHLMQRLDQMPEWKSFIERSVTPWVTKEIPQEPAPYPNDVRTAPLWRESYITCQEALYGIRHMAVAGVVQRDEAMIARAIQWLVAVAKWDPEGATSRSYNDEAAFRIVTALAWGFDWLRTELDDAQVELVRNALTTRGEQVARHVMHASRIDTFPYDSHAVRAVSAVLVPAGLAPAGEDARGTEWLEFATSYLAGPYSAWADEEGGWAEGIHYWTTAMCYALEAATLLRNATGLDLFKRPFFRNTGYFPLYCRPAWTRRATFGDDATLGDAPSPKIARNMRLLAAATNTPVFAGYADQIEALTDSDEAAFYNYGWWDFNFDDLLRTTSYPGVEAKALPADPQIKVFPGVGWASLQSRMDDAHQQLHCVFKSSPYGSISHSHGDQNAFCLSAFGDDIFVQSGHYVAHNSTMHRNWRRQTLSKNALLIDGQGQYAGEDKFLARQSVGSLVSQGNETGHCWVTGRAEQAYAQTVPGLTRVERQMHLIFGTAILVIDHVEADRAVHVTWNGHTNGKVESGDLSATIKTPHATTGVELVYSSAAMDRVTVIEGFDGVADNEIDGLEASRRLSLEFMPTRKHTIATLITPVRLGDYPRVMCFTEDQGFGKTLYCVREGFNPIRIELIPS